MTVEVPSAARNRPPAVSGRHLSRAPCKERLIRLPSVPSRPAKPTGPEVRRSDLPTAAARPQVDALGAGGYQSPTFTRCRRAIEYRDSFGI